MVLRVSVFRSHLFSFVVFVGIVVVCVYFYADRILKSQNIGFCVEKIEFDGNERISDILLLKASGVRYKSNIFSTSIYEAKKKLENIAWVKSVVVQRKLPNTLYIRIAERTPIAILQSKYKLYLIDADGKILENDGFGSFNDLPIIIGEGAEKEVDRFLCCINKFPKIRKQLVFAVRIGKRRWDIKINRGVTVKFPEKGLSCACGILEEISDKNGCFYGDISVIDLRMLDRIVITKSKREELQDKDEAE